MIVAGTLLSFILLSVLVEYLVEVFKPFFPEKAGKFPLPLLISAVIGIVIAWLVSYEIFTPLGFTVKSLIVAQILTGMGLAGGSRGAHELLTRLRERREDDPVLITTEPINITMPQDESQPCKIE